MRRNRFIFLILFALGFLSGLSAQEQAPVYSARAYWLEQQNPRYKELIQRQLKGDSIKPAELDWLNYYKQYLEGYYSKMSEQEKQIYKEKIKEWTGWVESGKHPAAVSKENDQLSDAGDRTIYTKYLRQSGYYGFYYGASLDVILGISWPGAAGVPFLTAGACFLVPMLNPANRQLSNNSLLLSGHGKTVGWLHGFALSNVLLGDNTNANNSKIALTISAASSIGLGYLGKELGKNENWTEGRIALYRHYGLFTPFEGASFLIAAGMDDNRILGLGVLASGVAGYYIADKISDRINYSRGDVLSMKGLTLLNGALGLGLWLDIGDAKRGSSCLPAIGAIGGTLLGHIWLKDYNLSVSAARKTIYAAIGGSLIGEGIALIVNSDSPTPYYLIPWLTGFVSYAIAVENVKSKPLSSIEGRKGLFRNWSADFQPQNLILGSRMLPKQGSSPLCLRIQPPPAFTLRYSIR